jgi:hypothetical protein
VVIGGDVIMTKEMLDISREDSATEAPHSTRADFPTSDASSNDMQGRPHPELVADCSRGRQPRPALATGNS